MRISGTIRLAALVLTISSAQHAQAQAQIRFQGMDRDHDGVITRSEWQGNDTAFRNEDWNADGVLSGEEVRPNGNRGGGPQQRGAQNARFNILDVNRDGFITRREWKLENDEFNRLDANRDQRINRLEFADYADAPQGRGDRTGTPRDRFSMADRDRSGYLIRTEWPWEEAWFHRIDTNRDSRVNRPEFDAATMYFDESGNRYGEIAANQRNDQRNNRRSRAAQEGFVRGQTEGRQAGQEDRVNRRAWDLDGQTELERAESGYSAQFGSLAEYQAGYRDGFRDAYREGYNSR